MKVNKGLENIADTLLFGGFGALIVEIIAIVLKNKLVHDMGVVNYRLFFLCIGLVTCGMFLTSMFYRHIAWSDKKRKPKVIGWVLYDKNEKQWEDAHPDATDEDWAEVEQAIVDLIRKKKYKFGGNYHQYGATGCPVMEDGTVVMVSMRHWGDIMSRVWGGNYCDYAWTHDQGEGYKVPKPVPGFANKVKWMTDEEIEAREKQIEESQKKAKIEFDKLQKEKQKEKEKEHKQNTAWAVKFTAKFFKDRGLKVNADVCNAVGELLVRGYAGCKEENAPSLKWIFDPAERKRVENARKRKLKQAWESFNKALEEHKDEDKTEEGK